MKYLKTLIYSFIALIVLVCGLLAFVPSWLSTEKGKTWVLKTINAHIEGTVSIEKMQLSWIKGQNIEKLEIKDSKQGIVLSIDQVQSEASLFSLLAPYCQIGSLTVIKPYLYLSTYPDSEQTSLEKALQPKKVSSDKKKKKGRMRFCYLTSFDIQQGTVILASTEIKPVTVKDLNIKYAYKEDTFNLKAITDQQGVKGDITASGRLREEFSLIAQINRFPVAILDQLYKDTLFTAAIGETLDCKIQSEPVKNQLILTATITSTNLNGALKAEVLEDSLQLLPGGELTYRLTPSGFSAILGQEQQKQWQLTNAVPFVLSFKEGQLPTNLSKWNLKHLSIKGGIVMDKATLKHASTGTYSLSGFKTDFGLFQGYKLNIKGNLEGIAKGSLNCEISGDTQGQIYYRLMSDSFPFALLDLVMDEAEYIKKIFGDSVSLNIEGSNKDGAISTHIQLNSSLSELKGLIEGSSLESLDFKVDGKNQLSGDFKSLFGPDIQFDLNGKMSFWQKNLAITTLSGELKNELVDVEIRGKLGEKNEPFSCENIQITANGKLLKLPFAERFKMTELKKGQFIFSLDGKDNLIKSTAKVQLAISQDNEKFESKSSDIEVTIKDFLCSNQFDIKKATTEIKASLDQFPAVFFNLFVPGTFDISLLTGDLINADIAALYDPKNTDHLISLNVKADSEEFKADFAVAVNGTLRLNKEEPATLTFEISPERYKKLMGLLPTELLPDSFLAHPIKIDLALSDFKCPTSTPDSLKSVLCRSGIVGSVQVSPLIFNQGKEILSINKLQALVRAENVSESIYVDATALFGGSQIPSGQSSLIELNGQISNLWNAKHEFDPAKLAIIGKAEAQIIPIHQILSTLPMDATSRKVFQAFFGTYMNALIRGEVVGGRGPLTLDFKASNLQALIPLQVSPNYLTLRQGIEAEITLTEEVSDVLLTDVNPLLIMGARSDHPLKLYIDPEGFSITTNPFRFKGITIEKAVLDLGKVQIKNGGQIQTLMNFLKAEDRSDSQWMEAWFTPIYFSLKEGTSTYSRFDILLAQFVHIALWGRIDLVKDKVRMTLGIAPSTLSQRFNVSLGSSDMFQVKMRGKTRDLELDWSSAYTRIGIIIARLTGGNLAYLVGGLLDQIITLFGEEPTPAPTTNPLPWDR